MIPAVLKAAWTLLVVGLIALAAGYFTHTAWQSYTGLCSLILGYVIMILDMINRKRYRGDAAGFYAGATLAPLIALFFLVFVSLLAVLVLAVQSMMHGFSGAHAMRLLHFLGILFAFLVVTGIPGIALRAKQNNKIEKSVDGND